MTFKTYDFPSSVEKNEYDKFLQNFVLQLLQLLLFSSLHPSKLFFQYVVKKIIVLGSLQMM